MLSTVYFAFPASPELPRHTQAQMKILPAARVKSVSQHGSALYSIQTVISLQYVSKVLVHVSHYLEWFLPFAIFLQIHPIRAPPNERPMSMTWTAQHDRSIQMPFQTIRHNVECLCRWSSSPFFTYTIKTMTGPCMQDASTNCNTNR